MILYEKIIIKEEFLVIEVKNITKKYGSTVAVDNISFQIKDGEIIGLLGPNGAGKSTTMNMITGYIEPTTGEIIIEGYNISKKPQKAKEQIGYMPEGVPLYSDLTVKEFVTYMSELKKVNRKERKEKVEKIIEETGLKNVEKKLIRNLSRGYKQRVSMAGALVGEPKILILDEPTVGLDPKQITEIRQLIKDLGKTHTIILSSHILSEVSQICNKVIIINKGKIIAIDTPENLEKKVNENNNVYVTVEDTDNKIESIKEKISEIKEIKLIKENEDKTKQYIIETENNTDLRKIIFKEFAKENITIFEMKQANTTLEDAFMKLIEGGEK
ncbi:MAG: ABC transporter ATP-binding protein [Clostridia bacterium]|nr:ABC transporter ATP-binding protein [Clostridia bacterium]